MIRSVRGTATKQFIESGKSKFSGLDVDLADRRLAQLRRVKSLEELGLFAVTRLHKLTGDLKGFWSISINGPWRVIFRFEDGDAHDVKIIDDHRG
jgi:toxin HigB-1